MFSSELLAELFEPIARAAIRRPVRRRLRGLSVKFGQPKVDVRRRLLTAPVAAPAWPSVPLSKPSRWLRA